MARRDPHNSARFWNDRTVPGLSLMCADFTTQEFAPHVHDGYVIAATETGGARIKSRGVIGQAHHSRLFVFNPAEPHSGWMGSSSKWTYRAFYVPQSAIVAINTVLGRQHPAYFSSNDFADDTLIDQFLRLHRELEHGHDDFRARELLAEAFETLFARYATTAMRALPPPKDRALFDTAREIMQSRYGEHLLLDELAGEIGLSPFQLIGLFKRLAAMTPHSYLTQIRLGRACERLKQGDPIAHAALACGFYDQAAFTHAFKRAYGITPLQFVRAFA
jgi:AraC-like DNA-binding protein